MDQAYVPTLPGDDLGQTSTQFEIGCKCSPCNKHNNDDCFSVDCGIEVTFRIVLDLREIDDCLAPGLLNGIRRWFFSEIDSWLDVFGHEQRHVLSFRHEVGKMARDVRKEELQFGCRSELASQNQ